MLESEKWRFLHILEKNMYWKPRFAVFLSFPKFAFFEFTRESSHLELVKLFLAGFCSFSRC